MSIETRQSQHAGRSTSGSNGLRPSLRWEQFVGTARCAVEHLPMSTRGRLRRHMGDGQSVGGWGALAGRSLSDSQSRLAIGV